MPSPADMQTLLGGGSELMWNLLKRIFCRKPIYQPFIGLIAAMAEKDPVLWERIRSMDIPSGIREWRKVHPEDFIDCQE